MNLHNLAVMFRTNDPNIGHCTVLEEMTKAGLAYTYGLFRAIPKRHWRKRKQMAEAIAASLELKARQ
jgi:hypothetical protein